MSQKKWPSILNGRPLFRGSVEPIWSGAKLNRLMNKLLMRAELRIFVYHRVGLSFWILWCLLPAVQSCALREGPSTSETLVARSGITAVRKGVWLSNVGSSVFSSRAELKESIETLNALGINTIYPVVWNKGLTTYNSQVIKELIGIPSDPQLNGRSVLAEIFAILQETGIQMEVIPWFEYGLKVYVGLSDAQVKATMDGPLSSLRPEFRFAHVLNQKGLLARTHDSQVVWKDPHIKANYAFLDPSKPQAREIIIGLVEEVTRNYKVSGIQFDDHFSVHFAFGGVPDNWEPNSNANREMEPYFYWKRYMMGEIVHLAGKIAEVAKRNRADARQISPAGTPSFSERIWMQDWESFLKTDAFNELVVQAYRDNLPGFQKLISEPGMWQLSNKDRRSVGIFAGSGGRVRSTELILSQIEVARNRNLGVNFFHYDSLILDQAGKVDRARFAQIKEALQKPWKCHPSLKSLCGN